MAASIESSGDSLVPAPVAVPTGDTNTPYVGSRRQGSSFGSPSGSHGAGPASPDGGTTTMIVAASLASPGTLASGIFDGLPASKGLPHSLNASIATTDVATDRANTPSPIDCRICKTIPAVHKRYPEQTYGLST